MVSHVTGYGDLMAVILLLDDEKSIRTILGALLKDAGHEVIEAADTSVFGGKAEAFNTLEKIYSRHGLVDASLASAPVEPQPEAVEPAGISVQLLQCYVIMGAAWAWFRGYQAEEVSGFNRAMVMLGAHTVMIGAVTVGLTSSFVGHQHHHGGPAQMQAEDKRSAVTPPAPDSAGEGLPVTDMGLDTSAPAEPSAIAPVPAGTVPEGDGHQHHHD